MSCLQFDSAKVLQQLSQKCGKKSFLKGSRVSDIQQILAPFSVVSKTSEVFKYV